MLALVPVFITKALLCAFYELIEIGDCLAFVVFTELLRTTPALALADTRTAEYGLFAGP